MTKIYQNVHGFNLKLPFNDSSRIISYKNNEWIEIIKKPNQLPTVKLTTIVLYYRNDGEDMTSAAPDVGDIVKDDENYRFYNTGVADTGGNGKQLGWIWGFPLFDVGRENVAGDVSGNWPRWGSCIGNKHGFQGASDICGNETMLVNLSANKNIIVLDCSGLQPSNGKGSVDISNNVTEGSFFMILRIKSSKESNVNDDIDNNGLTLSFSNGQNGNWNVFDDDGTSVLKKRWTTLVKYEYECDIIGPTKMLDFTFDYFMVNDNSIGRPIYQIHGNDKNYLAIPNGGNDFEKSRENSCKIITGLQTGEAKTEDKRMDIKNILQYLSFPLTGSSSYKTKLKQKSQWKYSSSTVVKLIGGWCNDISSGDVSANCYYGDTFSGTSGFITDMSSIEIAHKTEGWKNFINLSTGHPANDWSGNINTSSYELNNILWCSLQSPRKTPVTKYEGSTGEYDFQRYITNWIDLSGGDTSNEIIGGGYGLYPNTIDLPRKSINPYYSKGLGTDINADTVSIDNFVIGRNNYLNASSTPLELTDLNYFRVYYKLLIPPDNDESFKLSFTTGQNVGSVTTFVRYTDMSGSYTPNSSGSNNLSASRNQETITLKWDIDSVNSETNDISMQSICFTDIASGFSHIDASFNVTEDSSLNKIITDISKNYDISFNVFQLNFFERKGNNVFTDRDELPYTLKTLNTNDPTDTRQVVDISYVPLNYTPYRYINYSSIGSGNSLTTIEANSNPDLIKYFKKTGVFPNIVIQVDEKLSFNVSKLYIKDSANGINADIIQPENSEDLPENIIDISGVYDNSYVFFKSDKESSDTVIVITEKAGTITVKNIEPDITNKDDYELVSQENQRITYPEPLSLKLGNSFIPDYWRLPQKLNTIRKREREIDNLNKYKYLDTWENQVKISMVIDVLSLSLSEGTSTVRGGNITHLLVNSINGSTQYSALTNENNIIKSSYNLIFGVQGALSIDPVSYLNKKPIVVEMSTSTTGPFGPSSKKYIGEKSGYQNQSGIPAPESKGINRPYPAQDDISENNTNYVVDTILLPTLQRGNGIEDTDLSPIRDSYNGHFNFNLQAWNNDLNNGVFKGTIFSPASLKVLLVELPEISQIFQSGNPNFRDMVNDTNTAINIKWNSFYFSSNSNWVTSQSDVYWTIKKINISSGQGNVILSDKQLDLNGNNEYEFTDTDLKIFEKFRYIVTGKFRWTEIQNINDNQYLEIGINGFITPDCFICKNNRFKYGRFNTTSTNLKLFRPLLINTSEGQEDRFGNKTCGGGCSDPSRPSLSLYQSRSKISSSNNIYANTTNQLSKKQTYVLLAKSGRSNFR
mgnify:FL=1|tara:strand:- start:2047 stop:6000 length:3954 start_codon:yes stop_codon:yes gene_type:complete